MSHDQVEHVGHYRLNIQGTIAHVLELLVRDFNPLH